MSREPDAALLTEVAAHLRGVRNDPPLTAERIVHSGLEILPEAQHVSLTVHRRRNGYVSRGATSDLALQVDEAQYALSEGPCVDALEDAELFRSGDVGADQRWPRWGPQAAALGIRSLLSVRMLADGSPVGALNFYSERRGEFGDRDTVDMAVLFATHAALALVSADEMSGLETAMTSRHTIGMAQGIFMERFSLTPDQAFALLQRMSSTTNVKLREVAGQVVTHREAVGLVEEALPVRDGAPRAEEPREAPADESVG